VAASMILKYFSPFLFFIDIKFPGANPK